MSSIPQDQTAFDLAQARAELQACAEFIRDQEFYERLVQDSDWLRAKEDLTKEMGGIKTKVQEALNVLIGAKGSEKVDIQDLILELAIRLNQTEAMLEWFTVKVQQLKNAREKISELKDTISRLQGDLNA